MARYVMANRRAGKFHETQKRGSRRALDSSFSSLFAASVDVVNDFTPADDTARRVVVFDAAPGDIAAKSAALPPDVILEPEIHHWPIVTLPIELSADPAALAGPVAAGPQTAVVITVRGDAAPVEGAEVRLFLRGLGGQRELKQTTGPDGIAPFAFGAEWQTAALLVLPAGGFWSRVVRGAVASTTIDLERLPETGPLGWWHGAVGVSHHSDIAGDGIRVGVIDTGAGPHPFLPHVVDAGAFIDGSHTAGAGTDVDSHGSHVCGTIGARPTAPHAFAGIAPGAMLFIARVFPGPDAGANQGDIANAIDALSRTHAADLINMSLGAGQPSEIERDAIRDALERGTLCICAAGNENSSVSWPAAFPETVAVSALGLLGWAPATSLSGIRVPAEPAKFGQDHLYLANFSNFGPEITCAAPGVGIIATVPARFGLQAPYAAMDGTSMASPVACGALARILSTTSEYLGLPRELVRGEKARAILLSHCRSIGLDRKFQGRGVPTA